MTDTPDFTRLAKALRQTARLTTPSCNGSLTHADQHIDNIIRDALLAAFEDGKTYQRRHG